MKIASNGIQIHVEEQGSGDLALVFLHYWGGSSRTWGKVIAALPKSYRTIAIDHRGWGESDAPASGYGLADLADDARGVIEALEIKQYVLIGHSMGGKVAQFTASPPPEWPWLVSCSAALASSAHGYDPRGTGGDGWSVATRESIGAAIDQVLTAKVLSPTDREQVDQRQPAWRAHRRRRRGRGPPAWRTSPLTSLPSMCPRSSSRRTSTGSICRPVSRRSCCRAVRTPCSTSGRVPAICRRWSLRGSLAG